MYDFLPHAIGVAGFILFVCLWRNRNKRSARIRAEQDARNATRHRCDSCGSPLVACCCFDAAPPA